MPTSTDEPHPTVLIVDKDFQQVLAYKSMFESQGYHVKFTHSGNEALAICAHEQVDLIVTEALLPDMPGLDFIETIASKKKRIPIVINTNHPGYSQNFRCWAADAIVQKSMGMHALSTQVANLLH